MSVDPSPGPLTQADYDHVYSKAPRLAVDIIVRNDAGAIYLTRRAHGPCQGLWHIPGGTVWFGEALEQAVRRIARRELSLEITAAHGRGWIEYPSHYRNGLDSPVGLVFEACEYHGVPVVNFEASEGGWFMTVPDPMHADQDEFLLANNYLAADGSKI
jgi:hypothetical protein